MKRGRPEGRPQYLNDTAFLDRLQAAVMARQGRGEGAEIRFQCPDHDDHHPSARYNPEKAVWRCDVCGTGGGALELAKWLGVELPAERKSERRKAQVTPYEICDVTGTLVAIHERTEQPNADKCFVWRRPGGSTGLGGTPVSTLPLYGCDKLGEMAARAAVVLVEGEKAADSLNRRGVPAVGTVCGASTIPCPESLAPLLRFRVNLWPDNDDAGRRHMVGCAERLASLGHRDLWLIEWPEAPPKGDAADHPGDADAIRGLLAKAQRYEPGPPAYLAGLLEDVRAFIRRYVVFGDHQANEVSLWTLHTHAIDGADVTPYQHVTSPEKRSGKTRLLEALALLAARPWLTGRASAAVLVRKLAKEGSTVLLDESDAAFNAAGDKEYAQVLRAVLNVGYRRGGVASLCVKAGADFELRDFPVFGPKMLAGIGKLPDTIADRCIRIELKRRAPNEHVERWRLRDARQAAAPIRERLERWAMIALPALAEAQTNVPTDLDDRAAEVWEPLLAIADTAGGDWPEQARAAALALSVGDGREDDSLGVRLLTDIHGIFEEKEAESIFTRDLVAALAGMDTAPWGDIKGKALDARTVADAERLRCPT